jgi:hypothetical protein
VTEPKGWSFWATAPCLIAAIAGQRLVFTRRSGGVDQVFAVGADGQSGLLELKPAATCDCDEPA